MQGGAGGGKRSAGVQRAGRGETRGVRGVRGGETAVSKAFLMSPNNILSVDLYVKVVTS